MQSSRVCSCLWPAVNRTMWAPLPFGAPNFLLFCSREGVEERCNVHNLDARILYCLLFPILYHLSAHNRGMLDFWICKPVQKQRTTDSSESWAGKPGSGSSRQASLSRGKWPEGMGNGGTGTCTRRHAHLFLQVNIGRGELARLPRNGSPG